MMWLSSYSRDGIPCLLHPTGVSTIPKLDRRRRRRGQQVRQNAGQADESIARSVSTRPGRSTSPAVRAWLIPWSVLRRC